MPVRPFRQPSPSKEQRSIMAKLDSIRMDSVLYDGLPLGDVVKSLVAESKKRDPEKRGINFLINANQPAGPYVPGAAAPIDPVSGVAAPPAPVEFVDVNSVRIKINPSLINLRLVDVLDAIVKVADHPIKYTVTDYAVIFSLRGPEEPMRDVPTGLTGGYPNPMLR
jgi:hypothetical protein